MDIGHLFALCCSELGISTSSGSWTWSGLLQCRCLVDYLIIPEKLAVVGLSTFSFLVGAIIETEIGTSNLPEETFG